MKKSLNHIMSAALICFLSACNQAPKTEDAASKSATTDHTNAEAAQERPKVEGLPMVTDPVDLNTATSTTDGAHPYLELDTDHNGLYDDTERKALLEVFQREVPELNEIIAKKSMPVVQATSNYQEDFSANQLDPNAAQAAKFTTFDLNGDGKVSIQEQTFERPPLSLLLPKRIIEIDARIPWSPNIFPEWITTAYLQEDVNVGAISTFTARGTVPLEAVQANPALQPHKVKNGDGIEFAANTGANLKTEGRRDARWDYRWTLFTFRIDANSGNGQDTVMVDINSGNKGGMSSPKIWYNKSTGLNIQYAGTLHSGPDLRVMKTQDVFTDGESWNVVVCGIRYGQMYASVNGRALSTDTPQPPRYSTREIKGRKSYIGNSQQGNATWAYDALISGLTEPSEAMVQKMTGWAAHRLNFEQKLPETHPYKTERPFLDAEDFPYRYNHDDITWNEWGNKTKSKAITRVNAGGARHYPEGFQRVFYDDFRARRISDSTTSEGDLWMGVGFNVAVGADARLIKPEEKPDAYPHDARNKKQYITLVPQGNRWRGSAMYSVNDLGYGYSWKGPKIFRIRCMFPKIPQDKLASGLFPAFWSYGIENIYWRTSNRIEIDWFEFDGASGSWLNGLSTHYHYPYLRGESNIFAKNTNSHNRFKGYGGPLKEEKSKIPGGIYMWDGQFHTWEFVVDEEMTYINVTIPDGRGNERAVEIGRVPTVATYLEDVDLQINYAMKSKKGKGEPKQAKRQDYVIDWVEVLQKADVIEAVPEPFNSRPEIAMPQYAKPGDKVVCRANLDGITDVRYYWYADEYPLTYGADNSYTLTRNDIGKRIRCQVKAVGALDSPVAWSNTLE
jgi:hypothetical protein